MQKKNIAVIGSTGSIGRQTLDIVAERPDELGVAVLAAGSRVDALIEQALAFRPALAVIADEKALPRLRDAREPRGIATAAGAGALAEAMERDDFSTVVTATVGYSGLEPTLRAIGAGKEIALANKETLVVAGDIVTAAARANNVRILPVDSEHSAIAQCLAGEAPESIEKLIITASGGPFRSLDAAALEDVTVEQTLNHPNWSMGAKITVDSATMLNKAFEIIEARWLFGVEPGRIEAVVHPQSIVHSMVMFRDGSLKAQLGLPDMHLPIRYALAGATRPAAPGRRLSIAGMSGLTFETPDMEKFPCLGLAYEALEKGGTTACTVNAANEIAVAAFLDRRIKFTDIHRVIAATLAAADFTAKPSYSDYVEANAAARALAAEAVKRFGR